MLRYIATIIVFAAATLISPAISATQKVTFYTETYPPFQAIDAQGDFVGFAIDILQATQAYLNFDIDIQMQPWSRAYRNAKKHPNTFIFSIGRTDKRLAYFKWVSDFYTVQDAIYKRTTRTDINILSTKDVHNYSLALSRDDVSFDRLNIDPNHTNVYIVGNQATAVKMLNFGRIDLNYNNQIGFREAVQALGINQDEFTPAYIISQMSLGLATHKDTNSELYNQMLQAFDTIKQNGEFDHIVAKWFPESIDTSINLGVETNTNKISRKWAAK